jgi:cytochrome P450
MVRIEGYLHSIPEHGMRTAAGAFKKYFLTEIADRRRRPRQGLMSVIAESSVDGRVLDDDQVT